jgi:SAM-dependent methyltransferase
MGQYYTEHLSAERLRACYVLAPPRTQQYLECEIDHVRREISPWHVVLEMGCGYGRVLRQLQGKCSQLWGIDTSYESLRMAKHDPQLADVHLCQTDAGTTAFSDGVFDIVACIQNGISAFKIPPKALILEAIRVTRSGGVCLFSTYSKRFWEDRLEWFRVQSEHGLLGEIDWGQTADGVIVCRDGFRSTTLSEPDFIGLAEQLGLDSEVTEVDESSLFLEVRVQK